MARRRTSGKRKRHSNAQDADQKSKVQKTAISTKDTAFSNVSSTAGPPSAFARLPHEVLVNILTAFLQQDNPVPLFSASSRRWRNELAKLRLEWTTRYTLLMRSHETYSGEKIQQSPLLDILLVSRAFYFAGVEAYYSSNAFRFENAISFARFVGSTDIDRRKCVRRVIFAMAWSSRPQAKKKMRTVYDLTCDSDEPALRWDVPGMLPGLKSLVIELSSGKRSKYLNVLDPEIQERMRTAWPSSARFEIRPARSSMVWTLNDK